MSYAKHLRRFWRFIGERIEGGSFNAFINWQKFRGRTINFNAVYVNFPLPSNYLFQVCFDKQWPTQNSRRTSRLISYFDFWKVGTGLL
jgi:hypothetical protein